MARPKITPAQRLEMTTALAKAIAFHDAGDHEESEGWAAVLVNGLVASGLMSAQNLIDAADEVAGGPSD